MTGKHKEPRTVNIFLGFFFVVNFCLGTGFLGVPYAFFNSGYLAAVPTLLVICFISWINANYLLEVMARAQALEYFKKFQQPNSLDSDSDYNINDPMISISCKRHPTFEITVRRKFEVVELCEIFFNKWIKYLYLIILSIYCFLGSWSFATVAGSAWAVNIPYNFNGGHVHECESSSDPFHHSLLPEEESCRNAYYFSLFLYALVVIFLSILDLKEQAIIQMMLGLMRFFTVGAIVVYSLAKVSQGGDACLESAMDLSVFNSSEGSTWFYNISNATRYISNKDIIFKFNSVSWVTAVPVITYAFIFHQGIASLTHPIKQKRYLWYLMAVLFITAGFCYLILGLVAPLWFKADVQEIVTLGFSKLTTKNHPLPLRLLSYYLILFPSLDVTSASPLMVHTVVNNLYIIIMGRDTSKPIPHKYRWLEFSFQICLRVIVAILPILAAFGIANLIYVLKYAGLMGFNICFFFPTALQWRSIEVCKSKFTQNCISVSGTHEKESLLKTAKDSSVSKQSLLSIKQVNGEGKRMRYMTPFSSKIFSHPVAVGLVGLVGVVFFLLTLASLAVHPEQSMC